MADLTEKTDFFLFLVTSSFSASAASSSSSSLSLFSLSWLFTTPSLHSQIHSNTYTFYQRPFHRLSFFSSTTPLYTYSAFLFSRIDIVNHKYCIALFYALSSVIVHILPVIVVCQSLYGAITAYFHRSLSTFGRWACQGKRHRRISQEDIWINDSIVLGCVHEVFISSGSVYEAITWSQVCSS